MLHTVAAALNRLHSVEAIGETITVELRSLIDYHNCRVHLLDAEAGELVPIGVRGEADVYRAERVENLRIPYGVGVTGRVAATGVSLNVPNTLECEFAVTIPGTEDVEESLLVVPMRYGEQVVGTISVAMLGQGQFDDQDLMVLETLASHAATAIQNARLLELERQATASARSSEQRYRRLVEFSPSAILVHRDGRFVYANPAALRLLGAHEPGDLLGHPILQVVHARYHDLVRARVTKELQGVEAPLVHEQLVRLDGTVIDVEVAGIPLEFEGLPAGLVVVHDVTARRRAEREQRRLLSRLVTAQEEERRRIARDLHDDPLQKVIAAALRLDASVERVPALREDPSFGKLADSMRAAIARMRVLMFELRPQTLDEHGLAAALRAYLEQQGEQDPAFPAWDLRDRMAEPPGGEEAVLLFRIAQEAITNVRKHAHAGRVAVELGERDGGRLLRIVDDGRGFATGGRADSPGGHLGITTMRERAEMAGGWLRIEPRHPRGTSIESWIPAATDL